MLKRRKKPTSGTKKVPDALPDPDLEGLDDFLQDAEALTRGVPETLQAAVKA